MILADKKLIPKGIHKDSVLVHLTAAYFHITRRMEQKTKCSQTRGFVLATLRGGATLNQNQIATLLGLDRTVVKSTFGESPAFATRSERKSLPFGSYSTTHGRRRKSAPAAFCSPIPQADTPP
jgi:hypothetical protein